MVCLGDNVTFTDMSWNGTPTGWYWTFADGTPTTSNLQNPTAVFNTPGWKTISLTVSTSAGQNVLTKTSYIYVSAAGISNAVPYHYDFENANSWNTDYQLFNYYNNSSKWTYTTGVGYNSNACVKLNNYGNVLNDVDGFVTSPVNLTGQSSIGLNFKISAASKTSPVTNSADVLRIYTSTDCGKNWALRKFYDGAELSNAGYVGTTFTPSNPNQWVDKTLILPTSLAVDNVRFKFEFTGGDGGNNVFIDNINIGSSSVDAPLIDGGDDVIHLFPNPTSGTVQIEIAALQPAQTTIAIYNAIGQQMIFEDEGLINGGIQIIPIDVSSLSAGIYLVEVMMNGVRHHQTLTIQ